MKTPLIEGIGAVIHDLTSGGVLIALANAGSPDNPSVPLWPIAVGSGAAGLLIWMLIAADYVRGRDWPFTDPEEEANRQQAINAGADPDTLRTGRREAGMPPPFDEAALRASPRGGAPAPPSSRGRAERSASATRTGSWRAER